MVFLVIVSRSLFLLIFDPFFLTIAGRHRLRIQFISDRHSRISLVFADISVVGRKNTACPWAARRHGGSLKASSDPFLTFSIIRAVQVLPFPVKLCHVAARETRLRHDIRFFKL